MVNCTQNNIISSVLLANKQSRDKILPILNKIRDLSPIEKLDPSISSALSLQKDLLNYNVHANLMFGEFAAIYRPVLANKFKRAFSSMEDIGKFNLQNTIKQIFEDKIDETELFKTAKYLFPTQTIDDLKIGLYRSAESLQRGLIIDYVLSHTKLPKKVDKAKLVYDILRGKSDLLDTVKNNPIYKAYANQGDNNTSNLQAVRNLFVYNDLYDEVPYDKVIENIKQLEKETTIKPVKKMKFPKIGNINTWESLQEKIISNLSLINDRETYDMIAKKLKEVKGGEVKEMFTDLISNYNLKEGINTEITPEQASAIMRKQGTDAILDWLKFNFNVDLPRDTFNKILNKIERKETIDEALKYIANQMKNNKDGRIGSFNLDKRGYGRLKGFLENYAQSTRKDGTTKIGLAKSVIDGIVGINSLDEVVFFDPRTIASAETEELLDNFSILHNKYSQSLGTIKVAKTLEELSSLVSKNSSIKHIFVPNKGDVNNPVFNSIIEKNKTIHITSSTAWQSTSLFVKGDELYLGASNYDVMDTLKRRGVNNGFINDFGITDPNDIVAANKAIIEFYYPNNSEEVMKIIADELGEDKTIRDFNDFMKGINKVDRNFRRDIINVEEELSSLTQVELDSKIMYLYEKFIKEGDDVNIDEVPTALLSEHRNDLFYTKYSKRQSDIYQAEVNLAKKLRPEREFSLSTTDLSDRYSNFVDYLYKQDVGIPFDSSKVVDTINKIEKGQSLDGDEFFEVLAIKNSSRNRDELIDIIREASIDKTRVGDSDDVLESISSNPLQEMYIFDPNRYYKEGMEMTEIKYVKNTSSLGKSLNSVINKIKLAIDSYKREVSDAVSNLGDSQNLSKEAISSKKMKLSNTLRDLEEEYGNLLGLTEKSYVFYIPSLAVNNAEDIKYFDDAIDSLFARYTDYHNYNINVAKSTSVLDTIMKNGKAIITQGGKSITVTIEQYIDNLLLKMPSSIDLTALLTPGWKSLPFEIKKKMARGLEATLTDYNRNRGALQTIWRTIDPNLADMSEAYKISRVSIEDNGITKNVIVPRAIIENNLSDVGEKADGKLILDYNEDLIVKSNIFKKVSEEFRKQGISGEKIREYVVEELRKQYDLQGLTYDFNLLNNSNGELSLINRYVAAFLPYTRISGITKDVIDAAADMIMSREIDRADIAEIVQSITYVDGAGVSRPLSEANVRGLKEYPDILYRETNEMFEIKDIFTPQKKVDKEDVLVNVRNAVDAYENGFYKSASFMDGVYDVLVQDSSSILTSAPRLRMWRDVANEGVSTGLNASKVFSSLLTKKGFFRGITNAFGVNASQTGFFDAKFIGEIGEQYKRLMATSDEQFSKVGKMKLNDTENAAYILATHYRKMKKMISQISTDSIVNDGMVKDIDNILDPIYETVDGVVRFRQSRGGADSGSTYLNKLLSSLKNHQPMFGLKTLRDLGIGYKKLSGTVGGFGNQFYDEIDGNEGLSIFNKLFNSNLDIKQYRRVMSGLEGSSDNTANFGKFMNSITAVAKFGWGIVNSPFIRLLASFPGSFLAGTVSATGYLGAISNFKKQIGSDFGSFAGITKYRNNLGILRDSSPDFTNLIDWDNVDMMNIQSFMKELFDGPKKYPAAWSELVGQGLDNGQNLTDAIFGAAMKDYAFALALKKEGFTSIDDYERFRNNVNIPEVFKRDVTQSVVNRTYDAHESMINYTGRAISRSGDTGDWYSKLSGMMSLLTNPINFRSGLGNNMIMNSADAIYRIAKYIKKYGPGENAMKNIMDAIADDQILNQVLIGWVHDVATGLKFANWNNDGENPATASINKEDVLAALNMLSQQSQFFKMSGPMRVLNAGSDSESYMYGFLNQYFREAFRQTKTATGLLDVVFTAVSSGGENGMAALNTWLRNVSTGGLRYQTSEIDGLIIPIDTGIPVMFGGENRYQANFYKTNYELRALQFNDMIKDINDGDGFNYDRLEEIGLNIIGSNSLYKALMLPVKALRGDRSNSSISKSLVADSFDEFDLTQDYEQNGKRYNFQSITPEQYNSLSPEDKIKYVARMDDVLSVMKDRNAVGTDNFLKEVSQYYKDGTTKYTDGDYKNWNDPEKVVVFKYLDEQGVLGDFITRMENSQNKEADMRDLTNIYVNAIMANSDKLVNADALAQKAWNSFFYQREVYNAQSSYNKEQKKITGNKKRKQTDVDDIILESRFVQRYWGEYQDVTSNDDGYSWGGLEAIEKSFARENTDLDEIVFNVNDKGERTGLRPQYIEFVDNMMKTEAALQEGDVDINVVSSVRGPYKVFSESWKEDGVKVFDKATNIAKLMHNVHFVNGLEYMPKEQKNAIILEMFGKMDDDSIDLAQVEEKMGAEFAEDYRRTKYQNYKLGVDTAMGILDAYNVGDGANKGGGGKTAKIDLPSLQSFIKKTKGYMDRNASKFYSDEGRGPKLELYNLNRKTVAESRSKPPEIPTYSAKSKDLFPKSKSKLKKPIKLATIKSKTLSKKKLGL